MIDTAAYIATKIDCEVRRIITAAHTNAISADVYADMRALSYVSYFNCSHDAKKNLFPPGGAVLLWSSDQVFSLAHSFPCSCNDDDDWRSRPWIERVCTTVPSCVITCALLITSLYAMIQLSNTWGETGTDELACEQFSRYSWVWLADWEFDWSHKSNPFIMQVYSGGSTSDEVLYMLSQKLSMYSCVASSLGLKFVSKTKWDWSSGTQ